MTPESFIKLIRESFDGSEVVYTRGSCYQFYRILKSVFPNAEAYYDSRHVVTKIGDKFYDITGEVQIDLHIDMDTHYINSEVKKCRFSIHDHLVECPECEHVFYNKQIIS